MAVTAAADVVGDVECKAESLVLRIIFQILHAVPKCLEDSTPKHASQLLS